MEEYDRPQTIEPAVKTLRWNNEEIEDILMKHLKSTDVDISDIANVSVWYEEEPPPIPFTIPNPHSGFVMRIVKKIKGEI